MSSTFALLQWSHGYATAIHGLAGGYASPLRPTHFPLADAVGANGASSSAPSPAPAATASGRKRKNAAADAAAAARGPRARPRVLCAVVDDGQFVVLDLESRAVQSQICYSLHDAQFGCPLSSGAVDVDAPLLSLEPAQCAVVAAGPEAAVLRLGGGLHVLQLRTQPVNLLSLVARLSVSVATAAGPHPAGPGTAEAAAGAMANGKLPLQHAAGGRTVVVALLTSAPAPVILDPGLLLSSADPGGGASSGAAAGPTDSLPDLELLPVPAASVSRVEDICKNLLDQLAAVSPPAVPPTALLDSAASFIAGRRAHGMPVPAQLLGLTARGLTVAKQWQQLGTLLGQAWIGDLSGCGEVLVAAAAAQQYQLLPRLCACIDEVDAPTLVATIRHLLAPTTRSNLPARQKHYEALRAAAAGVIAEAESETGLDAAAGSTATTKQRQRKPRTDAAPAALALARSAAATVDGFSYREALLHPLLAMSVDAPAVQVALRGLPAAAADALLGYLAKWVRKYSDGEMGEANAMAGLPLELVRPSYQEVLEWTRMTLDAHLTRLLMSRTPLPALEALQAALQGAVEGGRVLMMLRGALEHVHAGAPLPAAHLAAVTQYTAEYLDLTVR